MRSKDHIFPPERVELLKALSQKPDVYDRLARALAPSIYDNHDIKKGILLQLLGGTKKKHSALGRQNFRSELHLLLCGDPGTYFSKSFIFPLCSPILNGSVFVRHIEIAIAAIRLQPGAPVTVHVRPWLIGRWFDRLRHQRHGNATACLANVSFLLPPNNNSQCKLTACVCVCVFYLLAVPWY